MQLCNIKTNIFRLFQRLYEPLPSIPNTVDDAKSMESPTDGNQKPNMHLSVLDDKVLEKIFGKQIKWLSRC